MIDDQSTMQQEPDDAGFFTPEIQPKIPAAINKLAQYINADNVAEMLAADQLEKIGRRVIDEYEIDKESRAEWEDSCRRWLKMAELAKEEKSWPWPGAANIKLPLIANAAMKFAARAYGEIIRDDKIVKAQIFGQDSDNHKADRAKRVSEHMSYQLLDQQTEWEPDTDKLLHRLAFVGHMFRKWYWDKAKRRACSEILSPMDIVVNVNAKDLASCRRASHPIKLHSNDVHSRKVAGLFRDVDYRAEPQQDEPEEDQYFEFIEQHRWLDLDGDGYEEPYIVTVERMSYKVAAIYPRYDDECIKLSENKKKIQWIEPVQYITDYIFIPSFSGSYYGVGYGFLLDALNSAADAIFNQLLDAGTISNVQGGFLSREVTMKGGIYGFQPGEWKKTNATSEQLSRGVMPLPTKEPSGVLFNLLGMVIEMAQDLSAIKDVLAGDAPAANVPATTVMALIEQGMKTYNAIYKRIYRGLKAEFKVLYRLNYMYLDESEYYRVHDQENVILRQDYMLDDCDVVPVADPAMSSEIQRLAKAQVLVGAIQLPGVNPRPIVKQFLEAVRAEKIEEILPEQQGPSPADQMAVKEMELKERDIALREREQAYKERESEARRENLIASAINQIAQAEKAEAGTQVTAYKAVIDSIHREMESNERANAAGLPQLEEQPDDAGIPEADDGGETSAYPSADLAQQQPDIGAISAGAIGAQQPDQGAGFVP